MTSMMDLNKQIEYNDTDYEGLSSEIERLLAMVAKSAMESDEDDEDSNKMAKFERKAKTRRRNKESSFTSELSTQDNHRLIKSRAQIKILKIFNILITSLLYHHLCLSNFYQPIKIGGVQASQLAGGTVGNLSEPLQFFLPENQHRRNHDHHEHHQIKLVGGGLQPRSEEEEEGFIMRASSSSSSPSANAQTQATSVASVLDSDELISELKASVGTKPDAPANMEQQPPTTMDSATATTAGDDDQRIPINLNGQQYVTHEQLSLLNATTKDEHINLAGNDQEIQAPLVSTDDLLQRAQSPRTGMSKVSHVSSFISDYLSALVASRYRPQISSHQDDQQYVATSHRFAQTTAPPTTTTTTTTTPTTTTTSSKQTPVVSSLNTVCPGVCRSFLTAPLLCRDEINAACPSIFQKCCEKDDVSFNGTPVETSAPLSPSDSDSNTAPLSDNLQHLQEQSTMDYQTNLPQTSTPSSSATSEQPQPQIKLNQVRDELQEPGKLTTTTTTATTEESMPIDLQQAGGAIYFLSSGNGSESSVGQHFGRESSELEKTGTGKEREQQMDLAQPSHDRGQQQLQQQHQQQQQQQHSTSGPANRPHSTSQSFDSPLIDDGKAAPSHSERVTGLLNQSISVNEQQQQQQSSNKQVLLQTLNGTILYQPNSDRYRRPPTYANWTDYHLSRQTRPSSGNSVVYHPNTDPVKRPLGQAISTSTQSLFSEPNSKMSRNEPPTSSPGREQSLSNNAQRRSNGSIDHSLDSSSAPVEVHTTVLNDQHSMGAKLMQPKPKPQQPATTQSPTTTTTTTTSTSTSTTTNRPAVVVATTMAPESDSTAGRPSNQAGASDSPQDQTSPNDQPLEDRQPLKGVETILVNLWDWFNGPATSSTSSPESSVSSYNQAESGPAAAANMETHPSDQMISYADNQAGAQQQSLQQTNDRRLGLDLSFRQHDQSSNGSSSAAAAANQMMMGAEDAGLMTSDGASEQAGPTSTNVGGPSDRCDQPNYCVQFWFRYGCDSSYRSGQCGNDYCCVNRQPGSQQNELDANQVGGGGIRQPELPQQQPLQNCRDHGQCLAVYQQSLCTKPNELVKAVGCPLSHVCCMKPSNTLIHQLLDQAGAFAPSHNHIENTVDSGYLGGPVADQPATGLGAIPAQASELIKDSSLFAALLPPPPPSISGAVAAELPDKSQLGPSSDQFLVASSRQRPSSIMQSNGAESANTGQPAAFYQSQQQQQALRPAGATKSSQTGGIMSHIYQMFKSNGANKHRNRPQQQQQAAPSQSVPSFMSQMFEPYAQSGVRTIQQVPPQHQQLVFPTHMSHNVMFSQQQQQPASNYAQIPNSYPTFADLELGKQANRNAFAQHGVQMPQDQQQQQQFAIAGQAGSANSLIQLANGQQVLKSVNYGHQPQMVSAVNVHSFSDNGQQQQQQLGLINQEKFVAHNLEQPPNGAMGSFANSGSQLQQQQQQNYVKPFMAAGQQVPTTAPNSNNKQPNNANPYPIQTGQLSSSGGLNLSDRQQFHPGGANNNNNNNNNNNAPDNAHNVPINKVSQKNGQHPASKHNNQLAGVASAVYPGQPLAFGLGAVSVQQQQQQQQINKLAVETSLNRPNAAAQQVVRQKQQQQQQQYVTGGRNGNNGQESFNMEQQKVLQQQQRQNAASRVPMASHVVEHPQNNRQQQQQQQQQQQDTESFLSHPSVQSAASRAPPHLLAAPSLQQGNRLSPVEQQLLMDAQKAVVPPEPNRNSNINKVIQRVQTSAPNTKGWSPNDASQSAGPISPSSSNLNVMISSAPQHDQQRVESGALNPLQAANMAPRRQVINQQQQKQPSSSGGLVSLSRPPMVFSSPILSADQQQQQIRNNAEELPSAPTCPSYCLAPFVSFNCMKPNYIDKGFTCPTAGAICCVAGGSTIAQQSATSTKSDLLQQTVIAAGTSKPTLSVLDSNKLDSLASFDNDEQLDELAAKQQQQQQHQINGGEPLISSSSVAEQTPQTEAGIASLPVEESSGPSNLERNKFQCGLRGSKRRMNSGQARGRVMGGFNSKPGDWCWQAALMNNKNEYLCGGALIGSKWVLTAAHCVTQHLRNETQLFVRLGQHNLNQTSGSHFAKTIQVRTSYVHHNHNSVTLDNDIALLRLEEPVNLEESSSSICLVCLPERSSQMEPGKRCTVTGYGFETESGPAALRVRQTDLPIVTDQECQNKTSAVLAKPFALPASSFCAGGEAGQDACHGDGGSPLSCLVNGYYELTGIVSWGYKCGSKDLPGLYSKVSTFVGWINQIVSVNN